MLVSVVIPTYGRPDRLRTLLGQLVVQDVDSFRFEILVVDDGSPEPVAPLVQELDSQTPISLRCLRQANKGPAVARNRGAQEAKGEFLLFVDDDMVVPRDFISGHIGTQREFGPAAIMCHFDWRLDTKPQPLRRWYERRLAEWNWCLPSNLAPLSHGDVYEILDGLLTTATLSIRHTDFERVGGFDEGYSTAACEDQDFGRRLVQSGIRTLLTRRTAAIHAEPRRTLEELCERNRFGAADTVRLVRRFAHLYSSAPPIAIVNGYVRPRTDPSMLIAKKIIKRLVALRVVSQGTFGLVHLLERLAPGSAVLPTMYDLMVGAYIQRGWRQGLTKHGSVAPLMGEEAVREWAEMLQA